MNNIILLETNRIKNIMGIEPADIILSEAPTDIMALTRTAIGKAAGTALSRAEFSLVEFLKGATSTLTSDALSVIETRGGSQFISKLENEVMALPDGEEKKLYSDKINKIKTNYLKTETFDDLSKKTQKLFSDFSKSSTLTVNQRKKIDKIAKKITSIIPFYNKLNSLDEKEAIDLLKQFNVDFQATYDKLIQIKQQKRKRLTQQMLQQIDFVLNILQNLIHLVTGAISTLGKIKNKGKFFTGILIIGTFILIYTGVDWFKNTTVGKFLFGNNVINDDDIKDDEQENKSEDGYGQPGALN